MQLVTPPESTAIAGLRALKSVASADGEISPLEREYIEAIRKHILQVEANVEELEVIDGETLAEIVVDPMFRQRIINGTIMVSLMDGEVTPEEEALIESYAAALGTEKAPIRTMKHIAGNKLQLVKIDIVRRGFIGKRVKTLFEQKGLSGMLDAVKALGGIEVPALASKYRALEKKPKGTLGRRYWEFTTESEFSFPGEVGGPPEPLVFHDCVHVLADYGTSVAEEARIVAFQGGFQNYDPLHTMLFAIAQFHLGIAVSPVAGAEKGGLHNLEEIVESFLLGTQCNRDLSDGWDPWVDFDYPVDELRERYNIKLRSGN